MLLKTWQGLCKQLQHPAVHFTRSSTAPPPATNTSTPCATPQVPALSMPPPSRTSQGNHAWSDSHMSPSSREESPRAMHARGADSDHLGMPGDAAGGPDSPTSWALTQASDFSFSSHMAGSQASFLGRSFLSNSFVSAAGSSMSDMRGLGGSRLRQMWVAGCGGALCVACSVAACAAACQRGCLLMQRACMLHAAHTCFLHTQAHRTHCASATMQHAHSHQRTHNLCASIF